MQQRLPLSVFMITLNEEDRITQSIQSVVDWVDEVIVVDSGSTDRTVELAEDLGAKVVHHDWSGYGAQKRYGEDLCRNDWLLNIDADEEITSDLRDEIIALFDPLPKTDICKLEIVDIYPHLGEAKSWAYGYWQYRLYNRTKGRFSSSSVHDTVRPDPAADILILKGKVNHRSFKDIDFAVRKMNRISSMQRDDMLERQRGIPAWRLVTEFPFAFFKGYFLRKHCLYGLWGFVLAYNYAFSRFLRVAKMYEADLTKKAKSNDGSD